MGWMGEPRRTAVLISGRGSNLAALLAACAGPSSAARIELVLSNRAEAAGLRLAQSAGVATEVVDHRAFGSREAFDRALDHHLRRAGIELVCLAGFMRILGPEMVAAWSDRMLNVHPSLLPAFPGLDTHRRALEAGVRFHGCTIHVVTAELDAGPIVVQGMVPVEMDDTEDELAARVLTLEHRCYPMALQLLASGRARVTDGRVLIDDARAPATVLINPTA